MFLQKYTQKTTGENKGCNRDYQTTMQSIWIIEETPQKLNDLPHILFFILALLMLHALSSEIFSVLDPLLNAYKWALFFKANVGYTLAEMHVFPPAPKLSTIEWSTCTHASAKRSSKGPNHSNDQSV